MEQRWHFECETCGWDDKEAGHLATDQEIYCHLCLEDCLHIVLLRRWLATPETS